MWLKRQRTLVQKASLKINNNNNRPRREARKKRLLRHRNGKLTGRLFLITTPQVVATFLLPPQNNLVWSDYSSGETGC